MTLPDAEWPKLPDPNPAPPGTDLRTLRKGKFSTGQKFDMEAQLRHVAAIRMKQEGKSSAEIAEMLGYNSAGTVDQAIKYAMRKYVPFQVQEYAKIFLAEHFNDIDKLDRIIAEPGYKFDVKGDLVTGPDGEFIEDETVRTQAITERRKTIESARRLMGTDQPKKTELMLKADDELNARIDAAHEQMREFFARKPAIAALPDDIVDAEVIRDELDEE